MLFLPLYVEALGIESYGLVGVFTSLSALLGVLDLGLVATLDREVARLSADTSATGALAIRDLVRTFASVFWGIGCISGLAIVALAPVIADRWLNTDGLPLATVTRAITMMGVVIAFQWPLGIYNSAVIGLQHQVAVSTLNVVAATVRSAGAAVVVLFVAPTIEAFFLWQIGTTVLQTLAARVLVARALPAHPQSGTFRARILLGNWRFSAGMTAIMALSIVLTQVDRVVMSTILSLETFGYYALSNTAGRSLAYLVGPVFVAIYPRLCQLVAKREQAEITALYHTGCQTMAVALLPASGVLIFFAAELLRAWTGDEVVVENTQWVVVAIAIGSMVNGLMNIPYALQLAEGWTSLAIWTNVVSLVVLVPATIVCGREYGALGAAAGWAVLNLGYLVVAIPLMHRRLLRGEQWTWYLDSVLKPAAAVVAITLPCRLAWPDGLGRITTVGSLAVVGMLATCAAIAATPRMRVRALAILTSRAPAT